MVRPRILSSVPSRAVRKTIGTRVRCACRRRATSNPSMSGSITSSTIRWGLKAETAAMASAPVPGDSASKAWERSAIEITSTMFGSSSTTRTRCGSELPFCMSGAIFDSDPWSLLRARWGAARRILRISVSSQRPLAVLSGPGRTLRGMDHSVATALPRRRPRSFVRALRVPRVELIGLLALAAVLNLWALDQNGWANQYYSAAVRSMASSWHAFLYGSFDAAGVMTVDKPPLALWVQALSVKVFGFHPLAMLVPEALMGVATVVLVYDLVRRPFGRSAGFVAGLVLALTPIAVAISRHNNPDALLILCCVAALWFLVRGLEDGRTRWLVLAGVAVGLGFEAKMAVALMVVPGMVVAWLWVAPRGRWAAARQLLAGGCAMVVVGGAWSLLMALTPASDRPWISGTSDNSIWSLIWGYNGFGRLDGQAGGPGGMAGGGPGGGGAGGAFGDPTGWLRLLDSSMGGQAGWLLGFALVGGVAIVIASRLRRGDARTGWILSVGGAALTSAVAFSTAKRLFHPYYVSFLAPFVAALVGGALGQLTRGEIGARVLAPLAVAGGVVTELIVLHNNPGSLEWLPPVLVVAGVAAAAALAALGAPRARRI